MSFRFALKAARAGVAGTSLHVQMNGGPESAASQRSNARSVRLENLFLFRTWLSGNISRVWISKGSLS